MAPQDGQVFASDNSDDVHFSLFLSHASADKVTTVAGKRVQVVKDLKRVLEKHKHPTARQRGCPIRFRVCTYDEDFDLYEAVQSAIESKLKLSDSLLVLCSKHAAENSYVKFEIRRYSKLNPGRPVIGAALTMLPEDAFPTRFEPGRIGANLQARSDMSLNEWRQQLREESHKIVGAAWRLPVSIIHDRFEEDRKNRIKIISGVVAAVALIILFFSIRSASDRTKLLVENSMSLLPADAANEIANALAPVRWWVERELEKKLSSTNTNAEADVQTAHAAAVLMARNRMDRAVELLSYDPEPHIRCKLLDLLLEQAVDASSLKCQLLMEFEDRQQSRAGIRQALTLALGSSLSAQTVDQSLIDRLTTEWRSDPDAGVHSAIDWTLRRWIGNRAVEQMLTLHSSDLSESQLVQDYRNGRRSRNWFITTTGITMVVIEPATIDTGLPKSVIDSFDQRFVELIPEGRNTIDVKNWFAVATREVTFREVEEFRRSADMSLDTMSGRRIRRDELGQPQMWERNVSNADDYPAFYVNWEFAIMYCDWLTKKESPGQKFRSLLDLASGEEVIASPNFRLPTEAEWLLACRAGVKTRYMTGSDATLLDAYAWHKTNSPKRGNYRLLTEFVSLKLPNPYGLFDFHGNVAELCLDAWSPDYSPTTYPNWNGDAMSRCARGGYTAISMRNMLPERRAKVSGKVGSSSFGFRVAKSLDLPNLESSSK